MEAGSSTSSQSIEDLIEQKCDTKQLSLEFELQLLLDIMHKDGLVIAAK